MATNHALVQTLWEGMVGMAGTSVLDHLETLLERSSGQLPDVEKGELVRTLAEIVQLNAFGGHIAHFAKFAPVSVELELALPGDYKPLVD